MWCRLLGVLVVLALIAGCAVTTEPAPSDASTSPDDRLATAAPTDDTSQPGPSAAPPPTRCAPVMVLGVRGSGQPAGLGAEVGDLVRHLTERSGDDVVVAEAVRYSPSPFGAALVNPEAYMAAVMEGTAILQFQTDDVRQRCPDARIVLAGFSQGAQVVREAMEAWPDPSSAGVEAVVLLADPGRSPDDPVNRGQGDVGAPTPSPVPDAWAAVTNSWCLADDPVCDARAPAVLAGLLDHARGYRSEGVTAGAADALATLLGLD